MIRRLLIANRGETAVDAWMPLARKARFVSHMDPMTTKIRIAEFRQNQNDQTEVSLQLPPGASVVLRTIDTRAVKTIAAPPLRPSNEGAPLKGEWQVKFVDGGPD